MISYLGGWCMVHMCWTGVFDQSRTGAFRRMVWSYLLLLLLLFWVPSYLPNAEKQRKEGYDVEVLGKVKSKGKARRPRSKKLEKAIKSLWKTTVTTRPPLESDRVPFLSLLLHVSEALRLQEILTSSLQAWLCWWVFSCNRSSSCPPPIWKNVHLYPRNSYSGSCCKNSKLLILLTNSLVLLPARR